MSNNAVMTDGVQRYPNAVLVDWHAVSTGHPEFFGEDNTTSRSRVRRPTPAWSQQPSEVQKRVR